MPTVDFIAPTRRALLPFCFALHRDGRWIGVACWNSEEHHSLRRCATRSAALAEAKRIAALLLHSDVGGAL